MTSMKSRILLFFSAILLTYGCSTTQKIVRPTPPQPADSVDFSSMLEPPEDWHLLDEEFTQFRGISSELAYEYVLSKRSAQKEVVVAVIDGGVDINHEDLQSNIWTNDDEIAGNGKDDDGNGYVDDVNGWNFIGGPDGKNVNHDTFELTRIYAKLHPEYSDVDTTVLNSQELKKYRYYQDILSAYRYEIEKLLRQYSNIQSLEQNMQRADRILKQYFEGDYTYEEVQNLQPQDQQTYFAQNVMSYVMENDIDSTLIADQKEQIYNFAKYGYNPDFSPRDIVGDNYEDKTERFYGNNDVAGPDPTHGTHVAGIIGAVRENSIGIKGIASSVRIMPVRAVPDGDERDKDVANAIRYAVDNGADIINMSFGKSYSPHKPIVDDAVRHAQENGVLMVHAAGNSSENSDEDTSYPTDTLGPEEGGPSIELWLTVGASSWKPGNEFVGGFSNYGDQTVDLFAPGVDIYSTMPDNEYERQQGTSMAAPVVSGTAALLMNYYPELTAAGVREIIMQSVVTYPEQTVTIPHKPTQEARTVPFSELSVSDGVVNVFRALQAADARSQQ
ncbi:S8 family peptidase [Fodinibius sediminis]|uniref:Subtilase family protein n=1 Tax=Fodinibius sediminis TaxID=1214077 RepID=A0A521DLY8_9BACT|nr:S8 family peptidase [Fodinibius sediminis]SMO72615.1 Subtilase family protein [Fodinibius sediminis]